VPIAVAAMFSRARLVRPAALVALAAGVAMSVFGTDAKFNDYKSIYAPLNVPDSRVVAELHTPRGLYHLLDNFTERVDTDLSNNAGMMGLPGPPGSLGLYRDGNRLAALPKPGALDAGYAAAPWRRCRTACWSDRACCSVARRAASASPRRWRWARARWTWWSRSRCCWARCATGWARWRPSPCRRGCACAATAWWRRPPMGRST